MKNTTTVRVIRAALVALIVFTFASKSLAKAVDMYLEIKDEKGKVTRVKIESDGSFTTPKLSPGTYSFSWGVSQSSGSSGSASQGRAVSPNAIVVTYEIHAPKDHASGMATGKRMHKPFVITKEIDKSTPLLRTTLDPVVVDADGDGFSGKVEFKDAKGKTMAMDDWAVSSN